jgi:hypothetical protein
MLKWYYQIQKKVGAVSTEIMGSVSTEMVGSVYSGKVGSISVEFPIYQVRRLESVLEAETRNLCMLTSVYRFA